jgi:hypothetical protein
LSHFTVLCVLPADVDPTEEMAVDAALTELLAPYDENMDVDEYRVYKGPGDKGSEIRYSLTAEELAAYGHVLRDFGELTAKRILLSAVPRDDPRWAELEAEWQAIEAANDAAKDALEAHFSDEEYVALMNKRRADEILGIDDTGVYAMSTYNPESKWDWWTLGGRWAGSFTRKGGGELLDVARKSEIDIDAMVAAQGTENVISAFAWCSADGWEAQGQMGWFGSSSDQFDDLTWSKSVMKAFKALPDDAVVALVDCHI